MVLVFSANKSGEYFGFARMASIIPAPDSTPPDRLPVVPLPSNAALELRVARYGPRSPDCIPQPGTDAPTQMPDDSPQIIQTPSTETAPRGRIINDSARGIVFWESESEVGEPGEEEAKNSADEPAGPLSPSPREVDGDIGAGEKAVGEEPSSPSPRRNATPVIVSSTQMGAGPGTQTTVDILQESFNNLQVGQSAGDGGVGHDSRSNVQQGSQSAEVGRLFKVEWMSLTKVPFHRTRGIRNPFNANREIKIARDGTEIEFNAGQKLLSLFDGPWPY